MFEAAAVAVRPASFPIMPAQCVTEQLMKFYLLKCYFLFMFVRMDVGFLCISDIFKLTLAADADSISAHIFFLQLQRASRLSCSGI